ncbi:DNA methyltransferase 1-associated protein 1-like [Adelges cooleyi]|uniref:DNA methyltransferase 1-associated protein 1-like n=1 Tax=Adelges cooleyi TaxID=133065 RepID=UPI00217FDEC7|nr:DNA methyltransferase 1-associated protein 1-like [Adelges cooleyi]
MSKDIRDIINIGHATGSHVSKNDILGTQTKKKMLLPSATRQTRRPEGMSRELYSLMYNGQTPPVTETEIGSKYKTEKARLGMQRVQPWVWAPFVNPAREDGVCFYRWRKVADEGEVYPFAKFNKKIEILKYSNSEYEMYLQSTSWSREETDRLFDMCERFDLRFIVIQGRWNYGEYENAVKRTTEDLKDRYYSVCNILIKVRGGNENDIVIYDAAHETRRKEQLNKLYSRNPDKIKEEKILLQELQKIETKKHESKTQDKKSSAIAVDKKRTDRKILKAVKRSTHQNKQYTLPVKASKTDPENFEFVPIKFPDGKKTSGVFKQSQMMKIPSNANPKKAKTVEKVLQSLKIKPNPIPTEKIRQNYNDLRNEIVYLNELKEACSSSTAELLKLKNQYNKLKPDSVLDIAPELMLKLTALSFKEDKVDVGTNTENTN